MIILQYCTRYNLNHKAAKDLLSLIQALTPSSSLINQMNMKEMFNFVRETKLTIYRYCSNCGKLFPFDNLSQNICSTTNRQGLRYFGTFGQQCHSKRPRNTFVLGDIEFSLRQILERPGIMK